MRAEIIKLHCLSCGAPLAVDTNRNIVKCTYCGHEHLVPKLLESYAQCPVCGRNDRVEKITTAKRNHDLQNILEFNIKELHFSVPEKRDFGEDYQKAKNRQNWGIVLIIFSVIFLCFSFSEIADQAPYCIVMLFLSIAAGIYLNNSGKKEIRKIKAEYEKIDKERELEIKKTNEKRRNLLGPLYEQLYYCYRDDIIFLPGQGDYAAPKNMEKYLDKHSKFYDN